MTIAEIRERQRVLQSSDTIGQKYEDENTIALYENAVAIKELIMFLMEKADEK